ncbi:MAG: hypothetical protein AAGB31_02155, partial [Bdellovibrio sp.]
MNPLRLAFLNLSRRKVSTVIALISIALAVACSGVLLRLNELAESRFETLARGGDALVGAKSGGLDILLGALNGEGDYPGYLPYKLYESLKAEQTVFFEDGSHSKPSYIRSVIPFLYFARYADLRIVATDFSFVERPV